MGYASYSTVHIVDPAAPNDEAKWTPLTEGQKRWFLGYSVCFEYLESEEPCTWRAQEEDMVALSKQYPGVLFVCNSESAESDNAEWRVWALNGECDSTTQTMVWDDLPELDMSAAKGKSGITRTIRRALDVMALAQERAAALPAKEWPS